MAVCCGMLLYLVVSLYRFQVAIQCCHGEIVLTASKRTRILTGGPLFLASLYSETISIILTSVLVSSMLPLR